jgi:hypothetical protein
MEHIEIPVGPAHVILQVLPLCVPRQVAHVNAGARLRRAAPPHAPSVEASTGLQRHCKTKILGCNSAQLRTGIRGGNKEGKVEIPSHGIRVIMASRRQERLKGTSCGIPQAIYTLPITISSPCHPHRPRRHWRRTASHPARCPHCRAAYQPPAARINRVIHSQQRRYDGGQHILSPLLLHAPPSTLFTFSFYLCPTHPRFANLRVGVYTARRIRRLDRVQGHAARGGFGEHLSVHCCFTRAAPCPPADSSVSLARRCLVAISYRGCVD